MGICVETSRSTYERWRRRDAEIARKLAKANDVADNARSLDGTYTNTEQAALRVFLELSEQSAAASQQDTQLPCSDGAAECL